MIERREKKKVWRRKKGETGINLQKRMASKKKGAECKRKHMTRGNTKNRGPKKDI